MYSSEIEEVHPSNAMKSAECYQVMEEIGHHEKGVVVYRAKYVKPEPKDLSGKVVVIKVFKRQRLMENVICLTRDIKHSRYSEHKNVTKVYCSFVEKGDLWVVMNSNHVASLARVMAKRGFGLPERMVGFVLREVLEGLDYLHGHKWMHKNLDLIALKLALGHIPARSYKELFAFLADWPEKLAREAADVKKETKQGSRGRQFRCFHGSLPEEDGENKMSHISPAFAKMVTECLTLEPSKRPTARQLLESNFFREFQGQNTPSFIKSLVE